MRKDWVMTTEEQEKFTNVIRKSGQPPTLYFKEALRKANDSFVENHLTDAAARDVFRQIIESYESEIQSLIAQYELINAQHVELHVNDALRRRALSSYLNDTAGPAIDKLVHSSELLVSRVKGQSDAVKSFENQAELLRQTLSPVFRQLEEKPSPLFTEAVAMFMETKDIKAKSESEKAQLRNVYQRWIEVNGDEPIRRYSSKHADRYIETMGKITANYGQSSKLRKMTVDELVKWSKRNKATTFLDKKTFKNHFTRLSILWTWAGKKEHVDKGSNVFRDWSHGANQRKSGDDGYTAWSENELLKLTENPWQRDSYISKRTFGMVIGIGSYTGMRLEEICRLRKQDVINIKGIWCFNVCEHFHRKYHPDEAWHPKTEAGERVIPIHKKLIDAGILEWAETARHYLFADLKFTTRDKKRGAALGDAFSVYKNRLGMKSNSVVFHSFRHNVSTQLRNTPGGDSGIRGEWIDDFLGHEYGHTDGNKSVGVKRYLDGIDLENVKKVADSVEYPDFWDIRRLMQEA